jgi:hypothetical protein
MSESECKCSSTETGESASTESSGACSCGCGCKCGCSCCNGGKGGGGKTIVVNSSCGDWAWPLAILGINLGFAYLFRDEIAGILAAIRMKIETCCAEEPAPKAAPPKPAAEKAAPTRAARKK